MGLADIANIPSTPESMATWAFAHMAHHRDINRVIFQDVGARLPEYPLDQFNVNDMGVWIYQHQEMHNNQNAVLAIGGNDLTDVDWNSPGDLATWIALNFNEHYQASNKLGV
jgi:hypothetical protein